jgi:ketopantoate reductase
MLQSIEKGLPTEIEAITGAILGAAGRHGIACPENERLYQAIKKLGLAPVR